MKNIFFDDAQLIGEILLDAIKNTDAEKNPANVSASARKLCSKKFMTRNKKISDRLNRTRRFFYAANQRPSWMTAAPRLTP